ncbi:arsenite methyltransferase [Candidatus Solincola tengchongensis]|uniref:arsenite methyltransferase n=1 Tax=Candidatus Solincola tengchongensis TaxID=2900693 RepID=UPI00257DDDEF|nr:arsenite methyltransferase [Candidatus Solincola tengchongensis]
MEERDVKRIVREGYGAIAGSGSSCCGPSRPCCCGPDPAKETSVRIGYSEEDLESVPEGANLGLGCGNPVALASLQEGETVLDLGSGPGLDCFLAAERVGKRGKVIGVDMTPEMLERARENARRGGYSNVEFRLGEIENLPVADNSVDVVISNCVINLSPDKPRVFREAFRVLKPGGRLMVSDIVLEEELPEAIRKSTAAYVGCISGAALREDYLRMIADAGFRDLEVLQESPFPIECLDSDPVAAGLLAEIDLPREEINRLLQGVKSLGIRARKPM